MNELCVQINKRRGLAKQLQPEDIEGILIMIHIVNVNGFQARTVSCLLYTSEEVKQELIELIRNHADEGEQAVDLLMVTKYFEKMCIRHRYCLKWTAYSDENRQGYLCQII